MPAISVSYHQECLSFFKVQRELIISAYTAVRTLRLILANNPAAKKVEVPDMLFEGKIWNF